VTNAAAQAARAAAARALAPPVLALEDVAFSPDARASAFELVVRRFTAFRGEAIALVGPSGAGKSTLLNLLGLAQRPLRAARFELRTRDGATYDINALWQRGDDARITAIRARHQGYVLQQGGLLPFLDIAGNIRLSLEMTGRRDEAAIAAIARDLGIEGLLGRPIGGVSVGQRQRVAIARAIVHRPDIVLADEPTANVHPSMADSVLALLREEARRSDAVLVMATHDVERAAAHGFELVEVAPAERGADGQSGRSFVERLA
jgi:putative ABC transport system ATP-binding protein